MNKGEMIDSIAAKTGDTKAAVERFLNAYDEAFVEGLEKDGKIRVGKNGFFSMVYRAPRQGRNPRNPEEVVSTPERAAVTFKASSELKRVLAKPENIAAAKAMAK